MYGTVPFLQHGRWFEYQVKTNPHYDTPGFGFAPKRKTRYGSRLALRHHAIQEYLAFCLLRQSRQAVVCNL